MTCREKLMIEHPECVNPIYAGGCFNCPPDYGYLDDRPEYCSGFGHRHNANHECDRCWDREIPEKEPETFHDKLVQTIKDVGQEIIDNAEDYAGTTPLLRDLTIMITFDSEYNMILNPNINIQKNYLSKRVIDRMNPDARIFKRGDTDV